MSALPSAEEIKLKIKVEKGLSDRELIKLFKKCVAEYPTYNESSDIIWFLVAKDLNVPVAISRGSASRPAIDLPPKEEYTRLIDFDEDKHFTFNARGYVLDKWKTNSPKLRGNILLGDETKIERIAVFGEHETWLDGIEIGEAFHFQGLGFMAGNVDQEGRSWPRTLCTGFRTVIEQIISNDFDLPPVGRTALTIPDLEHVLEKETVLLRGIVLSSEMTNRYVGCTGTGCWKGTKQEEGVKVKCEKCGRFIKGVMLQGLELTIQDGSGTSARVRFSPWFVADDDISEGMDILILGEYNNRYKAFDGRRVMTVPDDGSLVREYTIKDLDFSRDGTKGAEEPEEFDEYVDMIEDQLPTIITSLGGQTADEFSLLLEAKWGSRLKIKGIVEHLIEKGKLEVRKEKDDDEPKLYWVE